MRNIAIILLSSLLTISNSYTAEKTLKAKVQQKSQNKKSETQKAEKTKEARSEQPIVSNREIPGIVNVHSIGIGLGQTFLMGEFEANGDDQITGDLIYNYSASYTFDIMVNLHYSKHEYKDRNVKLFGITPSLKGKIFQMDSFSPFIMAGLGFYRPRTIRFVNNQNTESEAKYVFGWNLGAGAELRLNRHFVAGVMGALHNPFDVKQDNAPKVEGSYAKLLLTLMYTF